MPPAAPRTFPVHLPTGLRPLGALTVLACLLGALACGASDASRRAGLQSQREAEFADLDQQAGMTTPSYLHPSDASHPLPGHRVLEAEADPQVLSGSSTK